MKKHIVGLAVAALAQQALASDYYVVVPVPNRTIAADKISVAINPITLPAGQVGVAYAGFDFRSVLQVTGDPAFSQGAVTWKVASGTLPAGLTLSASGQLAGTPTVAASSTFQLQAVYKTKVGAQSYSVIVSDFTIGLASGSLPDAVNTVAYSKDLAASLTISGDSTYTGTAVSWAVSGGTLPAGLALGAGTGVISGNPTVTGAFSFTTTATYKGRSAQGSYTLNVVDYIGLRTQSAGYRTWADGSLATSCNGYRNPAQSKYRYADATGDGVYRIQPTAGGALTVYCDMTRDGGGWTLAARILRDDVSHTNTGAVSSPTSPTQTTPAKLSDASINSLAGTHMVLRSDSGVVSYWQFAGIPFAASGAAASRPVSQTYVGTYQTSPVDNAHGGLNAYPLWTVVYGDSVAGSGCRHGMAASSSDWCGAGSSGTMWVK